MRSNSKIIIVSVLCVFSIISCTSDKPEGKPDSEPEPIAQVQTIKLQKSEISETLSVYGTVLPWPDKLQTISVPYTSRIEKLEVNEGQLVQQGDVLLTLKPGEDAVLQLIRRQTAPDIKDSYGLGFAVGADWCGHGGAHATNMQIDRQRGLVLVWMVQHNGFPGNGGKSQDAFRQAALAAFAPWQESAMKP